MKTSVFVGASVDGFIARSDGALDFLSVSGADQDNGYDEFFATVDALVIGRNTYDIVRPFPTWPYGPKPVFVLSTRPIAPAPPGSAVERTSGTPAEVLSPCRSRVPTRLRRRRHHDSALPSCRPYPASRHHACASPHRSRDSTVRPGQCRYSTHTRRYAGNLRWRRPERVRYPTGPRFQHEESASSRRHLTLYR